MIKHFVLLVLLSLGLMSATQAMSEQQALSKFSQIKRSEYRWVIAQWEKEMQIKRRSRSSARRSVWGDGSFDPRSHNPLDGLPEKENTTPNTPDTPYEPDNPTNPDDPYIPYDPYDPYDPIKQ